MRGSPDSALPSDRTSPVSASPTVLEVNRKQLLVDHARDEPILELWMVDAFDVGVVGNVDVRARRDGLARIGACAAGRHLAVVDLDCGLVSSSGSAVCFAEAMQAL